MLRRTNRSHYKVSVQDSNGTVAPTMYIPKDAVPHIEDQDKQYKALLKVARERSGLGRYPQWNFR